MNNLSKTSLALSILLCGATVFAQEQQAPPQGSPPQGYGPERYGAPAAPVQQDGRYAPPQNMPQAAPAPVSMPPATPTSDLMLPAGTLITVRVNQVLSSDHNQPGDGFSASIQQPLVANGFIVAARGQSVIGRVTAAEKAGRVKGVSKLGVELGELTFVDGQQAPIRTELVEQRGETSQGRDAAGIATTTGLGAAIGAGVNGGVGAGVGAAAGLVAGIAGVMLTRGHETVIYPEQTLTFRLKDPVTISTARGAAAFQPVALTDYQNGSGYGNGPQMARYAPYGRPYYAPSPYYATYYNPYYGFYPGFGYGYGYYAGPTFFFRVGRSGPFRGYRR
jgi:hypothetical protein